MTVAERQRRRQELQGNTPHGRNVIAAQNNQPPPLVDRPLNDPTPATKDNPAGDVPFPPGLDAAFDEAANRPKPLPVIRDAATAYKLAERMRALGREKLGENYDRGARALALFQQQYPGAMEAYKQELVQTKWMDENLDTTPHKSSRLTAAQRKATAQRHRAEGMEPTYASMAAAKNIPIPKSVAELPPLEAGSRAAVLEREEGLGLDTTSGITSFGDAFNLARKVNGSESQFRMLYGIAKDNLEHAGVTLPRGLDPINFNEDLGQLEALVPTEDGKVRRVLVDPEFFRPEDIGSVADIEELFAMTGATLSQITGGSTVRVANKLAARHPALAEFVGDYGWRNTGIVLEGLLDAEMLGGQTTLDDVVKALDKSDNFGESATGTAFSRVLGRIINGRAQGHKQDIDIDVEQYRRKGMSDAEASEAAQAEVQKNLQESADTLEKVQELTDVPFVTTGAEASGSKLAIAQQQGRRSRLNPREQAELDIVEQRNKEALKDAVDNVHNNRLPTNPAANPEQTAAAVSEQIVAKGEAARDIQLTMSSFTDEGGQVDFYTWTLPRGTGRVNTKGLGKRGEAGYSDLEEGIPGATVRVNHAAKEVHIQWVGEDEAFPGGGPLIMERVLRDLSDIPGDYKFVSDNQLSQYSMAMMEQLEKDGFRLSPSVAEVKSGKAGTYVQEDGDVTWTYGPGREPVFEIVEVPGRMQRVALAADTASYSQSRTAEILEEGEALVAEHKGWAEFWGLKFRSLIGWQAEREKSIYSIANPRTSKLNQFAKRLEARVERSLTGMDASEADRTLGQVFRKQVDEDGYPVLEGLTEDRLDIGQLMRARDSLTALGERTNDPEVLALASYVDDMLTNGKMLDNFGNVVDENTSTAIRNSMSELRTSTDLLRNSESAITSSPLFKKNQAGEYINTDLKTMGQLLANGSKFMQHLKPWLRGNAGANSQLQSALMDIYRSTVLDGSGFTASKHNTFLRNYRVALEEVFSPEDLATFRRTSFTPDGKNIVMDRVERSTRILNRLEQYGTLRAGHIVEDLTKIGQTGKPRQRTKFYINELERMNPKLAQQVRADSLEETRRMINDRFFGDAAANNPIKHAEVFKTWIDTNKDALRALHGDQYVTDLESIWRGMHLDTQRMRISKSAPELQGDVVRTSRTLMGPLNVWQRRVSAFNWLRLRHTAKAASEVLSDPDKLRQLNAAKGIPMKSRPGIAVLARIGIIPGTGWDGNGEMPQDVYDKGVEFVNWLEQVQGELDASENVE